MAGNAGLTAPWQPVTQAERYRVIDVLRGVALFGVLLMNLLSAFRISLFTHILTFHTDAGWLNHLVDFLSKGLVEFNAFTLFSLLFGVGVGIQSERASQREGISLTRYFLRRFVVLLVIGLCHLFLIWNGDILTLYAVCGLLLVPLVRLPTPVLVAAGFVVIVLPDFVSFGMPFPSEAAMRSQAQQANQIYSHGSFMTILVFRCREAWTFIVPLLVDSLPRTLGLMLWGMALWRSGLFRRPEAYRIVLWSVFLTCGIVGGTATALDVYIDATKNKLPISWLVGDLDTHIALAFAYGAGLLLRVTPVRSRGMFASLLAPAGQMALTNYLSQSVILGLIFYSYGLGLFGKVGSAMGAAIAVVLYGCQLFFSRWWLERYRFGPVEWLWRSLTYGQKQPFRVQ